MRNYLLTILTLLIVQLQKQVLSSKSEELIIQRYFFNQSKLESLLQQSSTAANILTYKINHQILVNQTPTDHNQTNKIQDLLLQAECDVQTIQKDQNTYEIAVSYSKINKSTTDGELHIGAEQSQETYTRRILEQQNELIDAAKYGGNHEISKDGKTIKGEFPSGTFQGIERNDRFFILEVDSKSGKVLSLKAENGIEEDPIINWVTQQLINDIFPDLRKSSYEQQQIQEEDNLGTYNTTFQHFQQDNNNNLSLLKKSHDHSKYTQKHIEKLEFPKINSERSIHINQQTGVAHQGNFTYHFSHGSNSPQQEQEQDKEALGMIHGHVKQSFVLIPTQENFEHLSKEMTRYRTEMDFHPCKLHQENKATFKIGNGEHEPFQIKPFLEPTEFVKSNNTGDFSDYFFDFPQKLEEIHQEPLQKIKRKLEIKEVTVEMLNEICYTEWPWHFQYLQKLECDTIKKQYQEYQNYKDELEKAKEKSLKFKSIYSYSKQLTSLNIFGNNIHLDLEYIAKNETSYIEVKAMLNNHTISTLFHTEWANCKTKPMDMKQKKDLTLFQATYPILGLIDIPIESKLRLDYGFLSGLEGGQRLCEFHFDPYVKGSIYASGSASLHHIISAGIHAQGTFVDTKLNLKMGSDHGKSYVSLGGSFQAIDFSVGADYETYHCSLKQAYSRRVLTAKQGNFLGRRRALWPHWAFLSKISHFVKRAWHKVVSVVKKVVKVVKNIVHKGIFHTFCSKTKGYKQIWSKTTTPYNKTFFHKEIDYGL